MDNKMCFVFGSNTAGIHGAGAAQFAYKKKGARWGFSYGHMGESFAIPTKGHKHYPASAKHPAGIGVGDTLPLTQIEDYVRGFLAYATAHPELQFQVTCIGCGLAGLRHEDIAPMFKDAPDNCWFDNKWFPYLTTGAGDKPQHKFWGEG